MKLDKLILLTLTLIFLSSLTFAENCQAYFVYSQTCPHCSEMKPFIRFLEENHSDLSIQWVDIAVDTQLAKELSQRYDTNSVGVPRFYIGDTVFIGYSKARGEFEYNPSYRAYIGYHNQVLDAVHKQLGINETTCITDFIPAYEAYPQWRIFLFILLYLVLYPVLKNKISKRTYLGGFATLFILLAFIFISWTPEQYIKEYAESFPFPVFVFIIAFADGFNPCAFTVLIILLSLLTHTKSKHKMALIGGVFIITSAIMYFLFIVSLMWVGSWVFAKYGSIILKILGVGVLIAGAINLKDYFFFKKGISLTLSQDQQRKITKKARKVVRDVNKAENTKALTAAIIATATLAAFVNLVELGCTAILPAVYMATLFQSYGDVITLNHLLYTGFYSIVYVLPLFAILFNFIYYFKSGRITEKQGRVLKLAGGLLMVTFGLVMLLKPGILMF